MAKILVIFCLTLAIVSFGDACQSGRSARSMPTSSSSSADSDSSTERNDSEDSGEADATELKQIKKTVTKKDEKIPKVDLVYEDVRLVGGDNSTYGFVEVSYSGFWGTICDDKIDEYGFWSEKRTQKTANALCRFLGHSSGRSEIFSPDLHIPYGLVIDPSPYGTALDGFRCKNYHNNPDECIHNGPFVHDCSGYEDIGVACDLPETELEPVNNNEIRLVGGQNSSYGYVEVKYDNTWGAICDDGFDYANAEAVCRLLGFDLESTHVDAFSPSWGVPANMPMSYPGSERMWLDGLYCQGDESSLDECEHNQVGYHDCTRWESIIVSCQTSATPATTQAPTEPTTTEAQTTAAPTTAAPTTAAPTTAAPTTAAPTTAAPTTAAPTTAAPTTAAPTAHCGYNRYSGVNFGANIINGEDAQINEHPWMVRLVGCSACTTGFCGGTLISDEWVLTAAHCVENTQPSSIFIRLGNHYENNINEQGEVTSSVQQIISHSQYDSSMRNDFALIRLSSPVPITNAIRPACLPDSCADCPKVTNQLSVIAGWGVTEQGSQSNTLKQTTVTIKTNAFCSGQYGSEYDEATMLCAGGSGASGQRDTCQGDSGGPLFVVKDQKHTVCGVTSWGYGCADSNYYGVYANVCQVRDWIRTQSAV